MAKRSFTVRAIWDEDARVFVSESDIVGLHIEAPTVDEFEAVLYDVAPDLVAANHLSAQDLLSTPLRDLLPAIVWQRPAPARA